MSRRDEFKPSNPTKKYYDWSQEENSFTHYDSESKTRIPVPSPFRFVVLRQRAAIMGFTEDKKERIFSNAINEREGNRVFDVRTKDAGIAKGLWKEIKDQVRDAGGSYCKIIHAMDEKGEVVCIRIKGNSLFSWGESVGRNEERQIDEWICTDSFKEKEFNKEMHSYPEFRFNGSLSAEQVDLVDSVYARLESYFNTAQEEKKSNSNSGNSQTSHQSNATSNQSKGADSYQVDEDDDLPF